MRCVFLSLILLVCGAAAAPPGQPSARIHKVLPHLLDKEGRHTLSPSLYERDAYQAYLRKHPEECSGIRFDVYWGSKNLQQAKLDLRLELRGLAEGETPRYKVLERTLKGRGDGSRWAHLRFDGSDYEKFGKITAWRATISMGDQELDEQRSFLW